MGRTKKCPRCGSSKSWTIRRDKRRCATCRYEWRANQLPLHLLRAEWRRLLRWFLLGQSSAGIALEARLGRGQVLRALMLVRQAMASDIPPVFEGTVEIDETYLGGTWRNKRKSDIGVKEPSEVEVHPSKRYSAFCVAVVRYGLRWYRT
jgi:hypothetical protein